MEAENYCESWEISSYTTRVSLVKTVTKALPARKDRLDQLETREVQVPQDLKDAE